MILRVALTLLSLNEEKLLNCRDFAQLCTAMKVSRTGFKGATSPYLSHFEM